MTQPNPPPASQLRAAAAGAAADAQTLTLAEQELLDWLKAEGEAGPLRLLVGGPGSGKTAMLQRLNEALRAPRRAVFLLDAPATLGETATDSSPAAEAQWESALHNWLGGEANWRVLTGVKLFHDRNVAFRSLLATLIERVCAGYGDFEKPAVLLVDRLDELSAEAQHYIETHVLEPFMSFLPAECVRVLVAARADDALRSNWLSWAAETQVDLEPT